MNVFLLRVILDDGRKFRGTAWFAAENIVVTAYHCVGPANVREKVWWTDLYPGKMTAEKENSKTNNFEPLMLEPLCFDGENDVALLKLKEPPTENFTVPCAEATPQRRTVWWSDAYPAAEGDIPFGLDGTTSRKHGSISATGLQLTVDQRVDATWQGVSGGPVIVEGKAAGVITQEIKGRDTIFAANIEVVHALLKLVDARATLRDQFVQLIDQLIETDEDVTSCMRDALFLDQRDYDPDERSRSHWLFDCAFERGLLSLDSLIEYVKREFPEECDIKLADRISKELQQFVPIISQAQPIGKHAALDEHDKIVVAWSVNRTFQHENAQKCLQDAISLRQTKPSVMLFRSTYADMPEGLVERLKRNPFLSTLGKAFADAGQIHSIDLNRAMQHQAEASILKDLCLQAHSRTNDSRAINSDDFATRQDWLASLLAQGTLLEQRVLRSFNLHIRHGSFDKDAVHILKEWLDIWDMLSSQFTDETKSVANLIISVTVSETENDSDSLTSAFAADFFKLAERQSVERETDKFVREESSNRIDWNWRPKFLAREYNNLNLYSLGTLSKIAVSDAEHWVERHLAVHQNHDVNAIAVIKSCVPGIFANLHSCNQIMDGEEVFMNEFCQKVASELWKL